MSPLVSYKKLENDAVEHLRTLSAASLAVIRRLLRRASMFGRQRITVMLIPHTEMKVVSFRLTVSSLVFGALLLPALVAALVIAQRDDTALSRLLAAGTSRLSQGQANLQVLRNRVTELDRVAQVFKVAIAKTSATLRIPVATDPPQSTTSTTSLGLSPTVGAGADPASLSNVIGMMSSSIGTLREISSLYESHVRVLRELPTMWPVQGGAGIITTNFGPAIEPFTHTMYLHVGIDIADSAGTPLVASGNGTVTQVAYQPLGYGNFVLIRHRFGFSTRYAHMMRVLVHVGERVKQGQVIGLMGSTGLSTGPHVHFEIHLGGHVIDPMYFMSIGGRYHPTLVSQD